MQVNILNEHGLEEAALGMSLSFKDRAIEVTDWWTHERTGKIRGIMEVNAGRGMGHDKFLRQITVYLMVNAPRYFWSEFDTYKVGVTTQSESTMHTLMRRDMVTEDLEGDQEWAKEELVGIFNEVKNSTDNLTIQILKQFVPESYLQRRVISLNYAVLRCIIDQRSKHKLPEWAFFIDAIYNQCSYPELLPKKDNKKKVGG